MSCLSNLMLGVHSLQGGVSTSKYVPRIECIGIYLVFKTCDGSVIGTNWLLDVG